MAFLICLKGADKGEDWELPGMDIEIGRSPNNHVVVHDPKASRTHCKLVMGETTVKLVDLKSRNGTKVEGKPILEQVLHHDQFFSVGDTIFILSPKSLQGRVAEILQLTEADLESSKRGNTWHEVLWDELTRPRNGVAMGGTLTKFLDTMRKEQEEELDKRLLAGPTKPKLSLKDLQRPPTKPS